MLRYGPPAMTTRSLSTRLFLLGVAVALVALGAACGDDDDGGGGTLTAKDGKVTLVAKNNEWNADRINVPIGEKVTITVDNQDDGTSHNLHVKDGIDEKTKIENGPVEQELDVTLDGGSLEFVCDVHANMKGKIVAEDTTATTAGD